MIDKRSQSALLPFKKYGHDTYLLPPDRFLIIGQEILVAGQTSHKFKQHSHVNFIDPNDIKQPKDITRVFKSADALGTKMICSLTRPNSVLRRIKVLGKELSSTHVRLFCHDERGAVARLFDVRVGSDILLPRITRIHASATLNLNITTTATFSITLSYHTISLLPSDDIIVSIYDDGILIAEPVATKIEHSIVCRDQKLHEPYTSFQHERLGRTAYFVSHPSH